MTLDISWECYLTPNFTLGFSDGQAWYKPWRLASLNLGEGNDTLPKTYQYIPGQTWADRSKDLIVYAEINKTLRFGNTAQLILDTPSDRDVFEISDNEITTGDPPVHIGHMLPRMRFPYRVHRINLQAKGDESMPTNMFVGSLVDYSIQSMSDVKNDNQDGRWRIELNFVSFDHPRGLLGRNKGAPLWHHRANDTTDDYHIRFRSTDPLTYDQAITQIVAWMNTSRPTTDFPITFSYTPKGTSPYNKTIGSNPISLTGTVTFINGSTAVSATGGNFEIELSEGQKIKRTVDGDDKWAYVASITDANNLVLSSNYSGTTGINGHKTPVDDGFIVDGINTWSILEKVLAGMGAVEALGYKYIPTLSATGVIDTTQGGFAKGYSNPEDFRDTQDMYKGVNTDMTIRFNLIQVVFSKMNPTEYWIKFTLYDSVGNPIISIPSSGYEYVPYDANNTHDRRYYKVPTQEIGTYKWDAELVCSDPTFGIVEGASSMAFTPQTYQFLNSPLRVDYSKINSFVVTRGYCPEFGGFSKLGSAAGKSPQGCMDGGLTGADGGYGRCTDLGAWGGCYPDPDATPTEPVNATYGIQGAFAKLNTLSALDSFDTVCRLHSKKLYECHLNTDTLIREPIDGTIIFNDGYTSNLIGEYILVYSPEVDAMVMVRVLEQRHIMTQGRMPTILKVFRI